MSGAFNCRFVCEPCGEKALTIQLRVPMDAWASEIDKVPDDIRDCVREYLRGIYQRAKVSAQAKRDAR